MSKELKGNAFILFLLIAITFAMMYPISLNMGTHLPDTGDSLHNIWTIKWIAHKWLNPFTVFDANIMYPLSNTGTYGEMQFASALIAKPILLLFNNSVLMYNILVFLSFVLSGYAFFLLARYVLNDSSSAFYSALIFAFFPYRFVHFSHIQLLSTQWLVFAFYFFVKFLDKREKRDLYIMSFFFFIQAVTFGYLTIIMIIIFVLYFLYVFIGLKNEERKVLLLDLSKVASVVTLLLIPFYLPYLKSYISGLSRTTSYHLAYGSDLMAFIAVPNTNILYGELLKEIGELKTQNIASFFSGILVSLAFITSLSLLIYKLFSQRLMSKKENALAVLSYDNFVLFYFILILCGAILILGPELKIGGRVVSSNWLFNASYKLFPPLQGIRFLPQFIVIVMFGVAIICGFGFKFIVNIEKLKRRKIYVIIFTLIFSIVTLIEFACTVHIVEIPKEIPNVYEYLRINRGNVLELPVIDFNKPQIHEVPEFWSMYYSTFHWNNIVNGHSGFQPSSYREVLEIVHTYPSEKSIEFLKAVDIKYIIVRKKYLSHNLLERYTNVDSSIIKLVNDYGDEMLYEIIGSIPPINSGLYNFSVDIPSSVPDFGNARISINVEPQAKTSDLILEIYDITRLAEISYAWSNDSRKVVARGGESVYGNIFFHSTQRQLKIPITINAPTDDGEYELSLAITDAHGNMFEYESSVTIYNASNVKTSLNSNAMGTIDVLTPIPEKMIVMERIPLTVRVTNTSEAIWLFETPNEIPPGRGAIRGALNVYENPNDSGPKYERGFPLLKNLYPGEMLDFEVTFIAPPSAGEYTLKVDLVNELFYWFNVGKEFTIKVE